MRRLILTAVAIIAVIGLIGYAAHSLDLVGMIASVHQPPSHG